MTKRIDVTARTPVVGTTYPPPFDVPCRARERKKLGDAADPLLCEYVAWHGCLDGFTRVVRPTVERARALAPGVNRLRSTPLRTTVYVPAAPKPWPTTLIAIVAQPRLVTSHEAVASGTDDGRPAASAEAPASAGEYFPSQFHVTNAQSEPAPQAF